MDFCARGLYRYFDALKKIHFYTTNYAELGEGKDGYKLELTAMYIYPTAEAATAPTKQR